MDPTHLAEMDRWRLRGGPQSRFCANGRLLESWQGLAPEARPEDVRAFNQAWLARQLTAAFVEAPGGDLPAADSDQ